MIACYAFRILRCIDHGLSLLKGTNLLSTCSAVQGLKEDFYIYKAWEKGDGSELFAKKPLSVLLIHIPANRTLWKTEITIIV